MILCSRGHIYDNARFAECPYCNGGVLRRTAARFTVQQTNDDFVGERAKTDDYIAEAPKKTEAVQQAAPQVKPTESTAHKAPVTGWLVCASGEHKGDDFRISGERTSIGSGENNNISLPFASSISEQGEAYINFDEKTGRFFAVEANGKNNLRVNGEIILGHTQIRDFDVLEIGEVKLIFRSFCGEAFGW